MRAMGLSYYESFAAERLIRRLHLCSWFQSDCDITFALYCLCCLHKILSLEPRYWVSITSQVKTRYFDFLQSTSSAAIPYYEE